ncbi:MAG: bis-aminopropyl spermidine synthase family protein [Candidatus Woesearchaeota archaeon]
MKHQSYIDIRDLIHVLDTVCSAKTSNTSITSKELQNTLLLKGYLRKNKSGLQITKKSEQLLNKYLLSKNSAHSKKPYAVIDSVTIQSFYKDLPSDNECIDQTRATKATAFARTRIIAQEQYDQKNAVAILGDSDFNSFWLHKFKMNNITVFDIDKRVLNKIRSAMPAVRTVFADFRLDMSMHTNTFDVVIIDPPYSLEGLKLFLYQSLRLLKKKPGRHIYLSMPNFLEVDYCKHTTKYLLYEIQKIIIRCGCYIDFLYDEFNTYEKDILLRSSFIRITTTDSFNVKKQFTTKKGIYTNSTPYRKYIKNSDVIVQL